MYELKILATVVLAVYPVTWLAARGWYRGKNEASRAFARKIGARHGS